MKRNLLPMLLAAMVALSLAIVGCSANSSSAQKADGATQGSDAAASTSGEAAQAGATNGMDKEAAQKRMEALYGENKQIMVFDESNIHPERESERKLLDWDRTYFLTKYYCIG